MMVRNTSQPRAGDYLRDRNGERAGICQKKMALSRGISSDEPLPFLLVARARLRCKQHIPTSFALSQDVPMKHFLLACLCATVCLSPARGQSSEQKQQTVLALQGLQAKDGGFLPVFAPGSKPAPKSSLRATTSALRALKYMGGEPRDKEACLVFVERCFDQEGKMSSDLESSYRITRCFVMLKEKPDVERLLAFVARCRNSDGGYGVGPGQPSTVGATYYAAIIQHWLAEK